MRISVLYAVRYWGLLSQDAGHEIIMCDINLKNNLKERKEPLTMTKVEASLPLLVKEG
jgi:hypothetical protein